MAVDVMAVDVMAAGVVGAEDAAADAPAGAADRTHAELWLYGIVGGYWWGFNAKDIGDQLRGLDVDDLTVRIHSPGGDVFEGIAIANLLRNHKARVTTVVDGLAASSASIIAIAGDEVVMSPGSQMMIHDAWTCVCGNEKELQQEAQWIGKQSANLAEQYVAKAGGTTAEWRDVMRAEPDGTWYTAAETVEAKLVGPALRDGRAEVQLLADGASQLRACAASDTAPQVLAWNLRPRGQSAPALLSAGVNAYDDASSPNQSLLDYAVSQDTFILALPDADTSPANAGLDVSQLDDVVLRITHTGIARGSASSTFHPTCN